jgi:hypothetical protein
MEFQPVGVPASAGKKVNGHPTAILRPLIRRPPLPGPNSAILFDDRCNSTMPLLHWNTNGAFARD